MHANEIELALTKNNAYPISGREVFEILKSLGECEAMFKGVDTCFFGDFFVGQFPFEKNSGGVIDYSTGDVYFAGCNKLWINTEKVFKHCTGNFKNINVHVMRLFAAQNKCSHDAFYNELKERQDKISFSLIIQNKDTPMKVLSELVEFTEGDNDLFNLFVDAMLNRAIDNSEELRQIRDVNGLKRKILARLVGQ